MRLNDCQTERLLPQFMQEQADNVAIARTLDPVIKYIASQIVLCSDWGVIDDLPEEFIDALAWELDIDWFAPKSDRTLDVKKELVKNADEVHKHLGTKAAVESVARDIFGNGTVEEWFEYNGDPGTFKLWTGTQLTNDNVARFMKTVGQVKNARSHLTDVTCRITTDLDGPDVDHGEIIDHYGETDIYNQFWYITQIDEALEQITMAFKNRNVVEEPENINTTQIFSFEVVNSERISAALVNKSDPCYYYNSVITYNGEYLYNSYYDEEDL